MRSIATVGAVDSGKSSLLGRLLWEMGQLKQDELARIDRESARGILDRDFSLVVDGLEYEQKQYLTLDVSIRNFRFADESWRLIDCPGHVEYAEKLFYGLSLSDIILVVLDISRPDPLPLLHAQALHFLSTAPIIFVINKIDLVSQVEFTVNQLRASIARAWPQLVARSCAWIPINALDGQNIFERSLQTSWYEGPTLIEAMRLPEVMKKTSAPLRFLAQKLEGHLALGQLMEGSLKVGDVMSSSMGNVSVKSIFVGKQKLPHAEAGMAIGIEAMEEIPQTDIFWSISMPEPLLSYTAPVRLFSFESVSAERPLLLCREGLQQSVSFSQSIEKGISSLRARVGTPIFYETGINWLSRFALVELSSGKIVAQGFFETDLAD